MTTAPATAQLPQHRPRVAWVDTARCLAMFFIMWLHVGEAPTWISRPVGGGICLFFIMAGYFMPREPGRAARRALGLGLAWLLWSLITFGLYLLVWPGLEWTWARVFGYGVAAYNTPLWFLKNLTIFQLIIAALAALKLLPRGNWIILIVLAGFSYVKEPAQHEALRFDWMMAAMLGYCLRSVPLSTIEEWLVRHARLILAGIVVLLVQRELYPLYVKYQGLSYYRCSLPVAQFSYAVLMCLVAIAIARRWPTINALPAKAGNAMMFIFVTHSLLYAPIYALDLPRWCGFAYSAVGIALLTMCSTWLNRRLPRTMKLLTAR